MEMEYPALSIRARVRIVEAFAPLLLEHLTVVKSPSRRHRSENPDSLGPVSLDRITWLILSNETGPNEMEQSVKEMLKLIEEEGESFGKKTELYYEKHPELISHVEDFYRICRTLVERYDKIPGDLRKNTQSELESQGSGNELDLISNPPSPSSARSSESTPEAKLPQPESKSRAAGSDVFLGSGGISDLSRKDSDGSSSSSLETDSEAMFVESNEVNDVLQQRVQELEVELHELRQKLIIQEDKIFKISALEEELSGANVKLYTANADILELKNKLEDTNSSLDTTITMLNFEKQRVSELEEHIIMLESEILGLQSQNEVLKAALESAARQFDTESSNQISIIEQCKMELVNAVEKYGQEKSTLQAGIVDLESANMVLKAEVELLIQANLSLEASIQDLKDSHTSSMDIFWREKTALEGEVINLSQSNAVLEDKLTMFNDQMRQLEADKIRECHEKEKHFSELNEILDDLKVKIGMLTAEKEGHDAKVSSLINDIKCRDKQILQMEQHQHLLHLEHAKLITETEESKRVCKEQKSKLKELEEEVEMQKTAISDGAELKREAIRQLCFSLEHYRDGYHELRQLLQGHKRSAIGSS